MFHYGPDVVIPAGVRRTRDLWLRVGGHVSASALADLTDLEELTLQLGEIDTNYREQAGRAFHDLARQLDIPESLERQWFDEGRRF